jgi:hypothetical protein
LWGQRGASLHVPQHRRQGIDQDGIGQRGADLGGVKDSHRQLL